MHVTSVFESNIGEIECCRSFLLSFLRLCVIAIGVALRKPLGVRVSFPFILMLGLRATNEVIDNQNMLSVIRGKHGLRVLFNVNIVCIVEIKKTTHEEGTLCFHIPSGNCGNLIILVNCNILVIL